MGERPGGVIRGGLEYLGGVLALEESVTKSRPKPAAKPPQDQYASEAGGDETTSISAGNESVEGTAGIAGGVLPDTGGFPVAALGVAALLLAGAALVRGLLR